MTSPTVRSGTTLLQRLLFENLSGTRHGHTDYIAPARLTAPERALVDAATRAVQLNKLAAAQGS